MLIYFSCPIRPTVVDLGRLVRNDCSSNAFYQKITADSELWYGCMRVTLEIIWGVWSFRLAFFVSFFAPFLLGRVTSRLASLGGSLGIAVLIVITAWRAMMFPAA